MEEKSIEKDKVSLLIVLMGALGDVVRAFCILPPLKELYPHAHITWLVEPKCEGIVRLHPMIDEIIVFKRPYPSAQVSKLTLVSSFFTSVVHLRKEVRARKFDIVLDLQRHFKSGLFSSFSTCKERIGFHRRDSKEGNWLFSTKTIPYRGSTLSKVDHYLSFPHMLGAPVKKVSFGLNSLVNNEGLSPKVFGLLENQPHFVVLVMGSSWESKNWPATGYLGLIKNIIDRTNYSIVLVGDKSQVKVAEDVVGALPMKVSSSTLERVINLVASTNLKELLIVIGKSAAAVGPDSGPGHIAAALGIPYIGIFGPTEIARVAPYKNEHRAVAAELGCMPCWKRKCPGLGTLCMKLSGPEEVFPMLMEALDSSDLHRIGDKR